MPSTAGAPGCLERAEEIDQFLLLLSGQAIEMFDDPVCFAAVAAMIADGFDEIGGAAIMQEEDALSNAPERSGAELVGSGGSLGDAIGEAFAHVVND